MSESTVFLVSVRLIYSAYSSISDSMSFLEQNNDISDDTRPHFLLSRTTSPYPFLSSSVQTAVVEGLENGRLGCSGVLLTLRFGYNERRHDGGCQILFLWLQKRLRPYGASSAPPPAVRSLTHPSLLRWCSVNGVYVKLYDCLYSQSPPMGFASALSTRTLQ